MIPKIIHSCWLGKGDKPELVQRCMASWHQVMPETEGWTYIEWNEDSIAEFCSLKNLKSPISNLKYCQEAYAAGKYAFVSDYVRLWALEQYGGVYMDTDVEVLKSLDPLLDNISFIGFEESSYQLPGTCVMGCEAHCQWVKDMMALYNGVEFVKPDGSYDLLTNVRRMGKAMVEGGLVANGKDQYIAKWGLHVYDFHHFSPITSTRVMRKTRDTFAIHHFAGSWIGKNGEHWYNHPICREVINALIQIKRFIKRQK